MLHTSLSRIYKREGHNSRHPVKMEWYVSTSASRLQQCVLWVIAGSEREKRRCKQVMRGCGRSLHQGRATNKSTLDPVLRCTPLRCHQLMHNNPGTLFKVTDPTKFSRFKASYSRALHFHTKVFGSITTQTHWTKLLTSSTPYDRKSKRWMGTTDAVRYSLDIETRMWKKRVKRPENPRYQSSRSKMLQG